MSFKNFAYSLVATAPSPATTGTSLVVTSGHGTRFPSGSFYATVWPVGAIPIVTNAEIVQVTGISTDTFTIVRQQESTSARTIVVGDQICAAITAATTNRFRDFNITNPGGYPYAALVTDDLIRATGTVTVNLPAATGSGKVFFIKNIGTGVVTVDAGSGKTIDGVQTQTISAYDTMAVVDAASNVWDII